MRGRTVSVGPATPATCCTERGTATTLTIQSLQRLRKVASRPSIRKETCTARAHVRVSAYRLSDFGDDCYHFCYERSTMFSLAARNGRTTLNLTVAPIAHALRRFHGPSVQGAPIYRRAETTSQRQEVRCGRRPTRGAPAHPRRLGKGRAVGTRRRGKGPGASRTQHCSCEAWTYAGAQRDQQNAHSKSQ